MLAWGQKRGLGSTDCRSVALFFPLPNDTEPYDFSKVRTHCGRSLDDQPVSIEFEIAHLIHHVPFVPRDIGFGRPFIAFDRKPARVG
jgi:hypothetical protein